MKLKHIGKLSTVSWSPISEHRELLVAGTVVGGSHQSDFEAGAPTLELYSLGNIGKGREDPPILLGSTPAQKRFTKIAWCSPFSTSSNFYSLGVVAGGHTTGEVSLWNPSVLLEQADSDSPLHTPSPSSTSPSAMITSEHYHSRSVHTLAFNPTQQNLLATGSGSELLVWDLQKMRKPFPVGVKDNLTAISWNKKVQRILATGSADGVVNVWDLKAHKVIKTLSPEKPELKARCRAIEWHPNEPMILATASENDVYPVIQLWDLRKQNTPLDRTLTGHQKSIWSLSWCPHDPNWLLSSSKDNKIFCWNIATGEIAEDIRTNCETTYDVQWATHLPSVLSASSLDSRVSLLSLHDIGADPESQDSFDYAPPSAIPSPVVPVPRNTTNPPVWLKRPCGASFGLGGQLVTFGKDTGTNVEISHVHTDVDLMKRCDELQFAIDENNLRSYCDRRAEESSEQDRETWTFLSTQFSGEPATETVRLHLGLDPQHVLEKVHARLAELPQVSIPELPEILGEEEVLEESLVESTENLGPVEQKIELESPLVDGGAQNEGQDLFGGDDDEYDPFAQNFSSGAVQKETGFSSLGDSDDPFAQMAEKPEDPFLSEEPLSPAHVAAPSEESGSLTVSEAEPSDDPRLFRFPCEEGTDEELISHAIMTGNISAIVEFCQRSGNWADALYLSQLGEEGLYQQVLTAYFEHKRDNSVLRLVRAIASGKLTSLAMLSDLSAWKETLCLLLTYAKSDKLSRLCGMLGDRLAKKGNQKAANLCYICEGNIDKTLQMWLLSHASHTSSSLVDLMEKVIVLKESRGRAFSHKNLSETVISLYCRFASFLVDQGRFKLAAQFLAFMAESPPPQASFILDRIWSNLSPEEMPRPLAGHEYDGDESGPLGNTFSAPYEAGVEAPLETPESPPDRGCDWGEGAGGFTDPFSRWGSGAPPPENPGWQAQQNWQPPATEQTVAPPIVAEQPGWIAEAPLLSSDGQGGWSSNPSNQQPPSDNPGGWGGNSGQPDSQGGWGGPGSSAQQGGAPPPDAQTTWGGSSNQPAGGPPPDNQGAWGGSGSSAQQGGAPPPDAQTTWGGSSNQPAGGPPPDNQGAWGGSGSSAQPSGAPPPDAQTTWGGSGSSAQAGGAPPPDAQTTWGGSSSQPAGGPPSDNQGAWGPSSPQLSGGAPLQGGAPPPDAQTTWGGSSSQQTAGAPPSDNQGAWNSSSGSWGQAPPTFPPSGDAPPWGGQSQPSGPPQSGPTESAPPSDWDNRQPRPQATFGPPSHQPHYPSGDAPPTAPADQWNKGPDSEVASPSFSAQGPPQVSPQGPPQVSPQGPPQVSPQGPPQVFSSPAPAMQQQQPQYPQPPTDQGAVGGYPPPQQHEVPPTTTTKYDEFIANFKATVSKVVSSVEGDANVSKLLFDIQERMNELYDHMRRGKVADEVVAKLEEYRNAVDRMDGLSANNIQRTLSSSYSWGAIPAKSLTGLQRIAKAISRN